MDKENLNGIPEEIDETNNTEENDAALCICCQKKEASENSEYCEECETKLLKKKIPFMGWAAGFVSLFLSFFVLFGLFFGQIMTVSRSEGDEYAKEGKYHAAYEIYYEDYAKTINRLNVVNDWLNEFFETEEIAYVSPSLSIKRKMTDVVGNYYGPLDAYYFATGFLTEKELAMPFMSEYAQAYEEFQVTGAAIETTFNKAADKNADYKAINAELDTYKGKEGVSEVLLGYYKYIVALNLGAPMSEQLELLENVEKLAEESGKDYGWICNTSLAHALYDAGKTDEAMVYLDKIIENNKSDYQTYRLKMKIQLMNGDVEGAGKTVEQFKASYEGREFVYYADILEIEYLRCTGELEKAKALCVEADESYMNVSETNGVMSLTYMIEGSFILPTEIYRQKALISLTEGDYAAAFDSIMQAYQMESYYAQYQGSAALDDPQFYGTLYLSAKLYSNSGSVAEETVSDVEMILAMFEGGSISEEIEAIINGEKTVAQVLTEGDFEAA